MEKFDLKWTFLRKWDNQCLKNVWREFVFVAMLTGIANNKRPTVFLFGIRWCKGLRHLDNSNYFRMIYPIALLPPATKLRQGNVFTAVCHSVHGGVCHTPWADTPPGRHPRAVHAGIRSTSGRYASYWNAILYSLTILTRSVLVPIPCLLICRISAIVRTNYLK